MNEFALPILLPAYAEIWLLAMASVVLVADLYLPEDSRRGAVYWLSLVTLVGCAVLTIVAAQVPIDIERDRYECEERER